MTTYGQGLYGAGAYGGYERTLLPTGSLLDRFVGTEALTVTVAGVQVPLTDTGAVQIRHGRPNIDLQPAPATCTVTIRADVLPALPDLGDTFTITLGPAAQEWLGYLTGAGWEAIRYRFVGTLTDLAVQPENDLDGPSLVTLTGVSARARLGRTYVGDAPWPAELDGARAGRILALVPDLPALGTVDPGTVTVLARDIDRQPALGLLDALAFTAGAQLAERRDGRFEWHDASHRRDTVPITTLDTTAIVKPATASKSFAGLVNDLTVTYGVGGSGTVTVTDTDSIAQYGPLAASVSTALADADDALSFASQSVARLARPEYEFQALTVDLLPTVEVAQVPELLAIEQASLLALTGFPATGPFHAAQLWVEGWTETVARDRWSMSLDVVGYGRGVPALRWADVDPVLIWGDVDPALTWLDTRQSLTA